MNKPLLSCFILCALHFNAWSQVTIHKTDNKVDKAKSISYDKGKIVLRFESGSSSRLTLEQIDKIICAPPKSLESIKKDYNKGHFSKVTTKRNARIVKTQQYLGWGKRFAFYYGMALLLKGDSRRAQKILQNAGICVNGKEDTLDAQLLAIGLIACRLKQKGSKEINNKLNKMAPKLHTVAKPFFYNLQGDLLNSENKKAQAVLAFYKTSMLDETNNWERQYAAKSINKIYLKLGDPRVFKAKTSSSLKKNK